MLIFYEAANSISSILAFKDKDFLCEADDMIERELKYFMGYNNTSARK
jgi:hypothetical protein